MAPGRGTARPAGKSGNAAAAGKRPGQGTLLPREMPRREQLRVPRAQLCHQNGAWPGQIAARRGGEASPLRGLRAELRPRLVRGLSPFWEQQALRDGKPSPGRTVRQPGERQGPAPCCLAGPPRHRAAPDAIQGWRVVSARSKRQLREINQPLAGIIGNALLRHCR